MIDLDIMKALEEISPDELFTNFDRYCDFKFRKRIKLDLDGIRSMPRCRADLDVNLLEIFDGLNQCSTGIDGSEENFDVTESLVKKKDGRDMKDSRRMKTDVKREKQPFGKDTHQSAVIFRGGRQVIEEESYSRSDSATSNDYATKFDSRFRSLRTMIIQPKKIDDQENNEKYSSNESVSRYQKNPSPTRYDVSRSKVSHSYVSYKQSYKGNLQKNNRTSIENKPRRKAGNYLNIPKVKSPKPSSNLFQIKTQNGLHKSWVPSSKNTAHFEHTVHEEADSLSHIDQEDCLKSDVGRAKQVAPQATTSMRHLSRKPVRSNTFFSGAIPASTKEIKKTQGTTQGGNFRHQVNRVSKVLTSGNFPGVDLSNSHLRVNVKKPAMG